MEVFKARILGVCASITPLPMKMGNFFGMRVAKPAARHRFPAFVMWVIRRGRRPRRIGGPG